MRSAKIIVAILVVVGWLVVSGVPVTAANGIDITNNKQLDFVREITAAEEKIMQEKEGQIIVQLNKPMSDTRVATILNFDSKKIRELAPDVYSIAVDEGDEEMLFRELQQNEAVLLAERNLPRKLLYESFPNDPYYREQWGLESIGISKLWEQLPSELGQVTVAVIDSGVDTNPFHEDLENRIDPNGYNFLLGSTNIYDLNGHGTAVAGIIAAVTNNNKGIAGVAGLADVRILPLQVVFSDGNVYSDDLIAAINYAVERNVDIINLSLGGSQYSEIENNVIQKAIQKGITVVASAGNEGNMSYMYPASYDGVISVGSIAADNKRSYFSNYNDKIDVVAPGERFITTAKSNLNKYDYFSGTSAAAPMVTGVLALLKAIDPSLTPEDLMGLLAATSLDLGFPGKDAEHGFGKINPLEALKLVMSEEQEEGNWTVLPSPPGRVPVNKAWLIQFNRSFAEDEIDGIVIEKDNNFIPVSIQLFPQEGRAIVTPVNTYTSQEEYQLKIFLNNLNRYRMSFFTE
ncbi:MAG: S8 family serine peptidase [Clostridia bacterium]|nr:S8 family serine peptidase [Clostridia bacterium]